MFGFGDLSVPPFLRLSAAPGGACGACWPERYARGLGEALLALLRWAGGDPSVVHRPASRPIAGNACQIA